jgi:hypothetical protein
VVDSFERGTDPTTVQGRSSSEFTTWNDGIAKLTDGAWSPLGS